MARPVFNRSDTLLGVCEALGQDLGFNANWLRVALAVGMLFAAWAVIALYLGLGVAVLAARALTPERKAIAPHPAAAPAADNDEGTIMLAEAA